MFRRDKLNWKGAPRSALVGPPSPTRIENPTPSKAPEIAISATLTGRIFKSATYPPGGATTTADIATQKHHTTLCEQHASWCCAMHDRTRRALAAVAEMDRRRTTLCATCEALLLTAASGLPPPMVRDEDGQLIDGEECVENLLARILADRPVA